MSKLFKYIDLQQGEEEKSKVLKDVISNTSFRGSNLWILACAIVIASVGLNVNSTAVIIGAMLISPLMGPIMGAGFALGTYDFDLLKKSGKNLLIATVVSLTVSTLYFFISPFKDVQSELLARTSPNIYDVLIAFFGGLVGVIAITRVEKGNPIPGVAIATALMPPLCTAGYGLAMGNYLFFAGALFLYLINCFFICIATFIMVKYQKYPLANEIHTKKEKQIRYGISLLIVLMIVPSIFFAYQMIREKKYKQQVDQYVKSEFTEKGYTVIYKKLNLFVDSPRLDLAFLTNRFSDSEMAVLVSKLANYNIEHTKLKIIQNSTNLKSEILKEIKNNSGADQRDLNILTLQKKLDTYESNAIEVKNEMAILFPQIQFISLANHETNVDSVGTLLVPVLLYHPLTAIEDSELEKLTNWLKQKLHADKVELFEKK